MNQRDLVWVQVPYADLQQRKARPALVVSHDAYNAHHPDVVVCAVTSNLEPSPWKVPVTSEDLEDGELPLDSMVRADKVLPVERELVDRRLGTLHPTTYDEVAARVRDLVTRST